MTWNLIMQLLLAACKSGTVFDQSHSRGHICPPWHTQAPYTPALHGIPGGPGQVCMCSPVDDRWQLLGEIVSNGFLAVDWPVSSSLADLAPHNRTATRLTPLVSLWVPCLLEDVCLPRSGRSPLSVQDLMAPFSVWGSSAQKSAAGSPGSVPSPCIFGGEECESLSSWKHGWSTLQNIWGLNVPTPMTL